MRIKQELLTGGANQYLIASKAGLKEGAKIASTQQSAAKKLDPENLNEHLTETHKFYKGDKKEFTDVEGKNDKVQTSGTSSKEETGGTTSGNYITREEFEGLKGSAYTGVRDGIWKEMSQDQKAGDAFSNMKADFRDLFTKLAVETSTKDKKMNPDLKKLLADDKMMQGESGNWTLGNLLEANREFKARGDDGGKMNNLLAGAAASDNPAAYIRQAINDEKGIKPEPPKRDAISTFEAWKSDPGKVDNKGVKEFTDKDGNTVKYTMDEYGGGVRKVYGKDGLPLDVINKVVLEGGNQVYIHTNADGKTTREVVDKDGKPVTENKTDVAGVKSKPESVASDTPTVPENAKLAGDKLYLREGNQILEPRTIRGDEMGFKFGDEFYPESDVKEYKGDFYYNGRMIDKKSGYLGEKTMLIQGDQVYTLSPKETESPLAGKTWDIKSGDKIKGERTRMAGEDNFKVGEEFYPAKDVKEFNGDLFYKGRLIDKETGRLRTKAFWTDKNNVYTGERADYLGGDFFVDGKALDRKTGKFTGEKYVEAGGRKIFGKDISYKDGNIIADGKVYDGKTGRENFWQEVPAGAERTFPDPKLSKNLNKDDSITTYNLPSTDKFNEIKMSDGTEHQITTDKHGDVKHSVSKDIYGNQIKTRFNPDGSLKSESDTGTKVTMDRFGNSRMCDADGRYINSNSYGYDYPPYTSPGAYMPSSGYGMPGMIMPDYGMSGLGMLGMMGLGGLGMYGMMGMGGLGMMGMGGLGMMGMGGLGMMGMGGLGMMGMGGLGMMGYGLGGMFGGMLGSRLGYGMGGMMGGMLGGTLGWGLGGMLGGGLGMGLGYGMLGGMGMGWGGLGMGMMGMGGLGMMGMGSWGLGMGMGLDGGMTMAGMGMAGLGDIYANGMLGW